MINWLAEPREPRGEGEEAEVEPPSPPPPPPRPDPEPEVERDNKYVPPGAGSRKWEPDAEQARLSAGKGGEKGGLYRSHSLRLPRGFSLKWERKWADAWIGL